MTVQSSEALIYEGQELQMRGEPLAQFLEMGGSLPSFDPPGSLLWRGYIGTWEIAHDRLYLLDVWGTLTTGYRACLEDLFPGFPDRVFAHWYSGTLMVPRGERVNVHHDRFRPVCEWDLLFDIERGHLTGKRIRDNRARAASLELAAISSGGAKA